MMFGSVGTGILIGHVLLLGELISFVPSAHPTIPLMGRETFCFLCVIRTPIDNSCSFVFSERELTFTFAICYRRSVCL